MTTTLDSDNSVGNDVSYEFGYPLGRDLRNLIIERTFAFNAKVEKLSPIDRQLINTYSKGKIMQFYESLYKSRTPSIDDFLLIRQEFSKIGKFFIAETILRAENEEKLNPFDYENTYDIIFHKYIKVPNDLQANRLFFITFNYDLSLELYRKNFLTHYLGIKKEDLKNETLKIMIIHPHGKLGNIESRKYGQPVSEFEEISSLASEINLMHEQKSQDEYFDSQRVLKKSKRVIFLGLNYHESNIIRLQLNNVSEDSMYKPIHFSGSCYGLTESEIRVLINSRYANRINFGETHFKNVEFLRNSDQFNNNIQ